MNERIIDPDDRSRRRGLLVIYTGQGKGKTTAALGVAFRALGRNLRVAVIQFVKGKWMTGERKLGEGMPGLTWLVSGEGFTWDSDDLSRDRASARRGWDRARALIDEGEHAIVILDELTYALNYGFIGTDEILDALRARPAHVHVIITGRKAPPALVDAAELVTDMSCVKHPFERGIRAQLGLDY